jgi:hypothetical protein
VRQNLRQLSASTTARLWVCVILLALLITLPGAGDSPVGGPPLSHLGRVLLICTVVLAAGLILFRPERQVRAAGLAALLLLILVKLGTSLAPVTDGWKGEYQIPLSSPPALAEFSSQFAMRPYRIDHAIDFQGPRFGLYFLNDAQRYGGLVSPKRRDVELPLHVTWQGYLPSDMSGLVVHVTAAGSLAVSVDDRQVANLSNPQESVVAVRGLQGANRITITYDKPRDVEPLVRVALFNPDDGQPVSPTTFPNDAGYAVQERVASVAADAAVASGVLVALALFVLAFASARPFRLTARSGGTIAATATLAVAGALSLVALVSAWQFPGVTVSLSAGDDWLIYESNARDIMQQGWLMPEGSALGSGASYFFYPLYPYALAGAHWLIGDDYAAVVLLNGLCVASLAVMFWALGWRTHPRWVALTGFAALGLFAFRLLMPYAQVALADSLYIALVFVCLILAVQALARRSSGFWLATGAASALAAATRPSFITFIPLLLIGGFLWNRRSFSATANLRLMTAFIAGCVIGFAPFAIRNYIVSGHIEVLVSSWIQIPYFLSPPGQSHLTGRPGLIDSLRMALGIVQADPIGSMLLEARKIAFTLGITQIGPGGTRAQPWLLLLSILFLAALALRRLPGPVALVLTIFAVSHIAAMVIAAPWSYGYKSILPLHAAFLFAATYVLPLGLERVRQLKFWPRHNPRKPALGAPGASAIAVRFGG